MKIVVVCCDGEGCTERRESVQTLDTLPEHPCWVARKVVDSRMDQHGTTRQRDRVLHYCPSCVPKLVPPLHAELLLAEEVELG